MERLQVDVYPSEAEAFETTAERATLALREGVTARGRAHAALAGGRGGRGVMGALASCGDLPWKDVVWWLGDERCVPATDPRSNQRLARETLFLPRGVATDRIRVPPVALDDAGRVASGYGGMVREALGSEPVFDVILLGMGADGHVASLMPGSAALATTDAVAVVRQDEVTSEPRVARVTLTPSVLRSARRVIVTVTGGEKAAMLRQILRAAPTTSGPPACLLRPSTNVAWVVDRAAATELLRDASPGE